MDHIGLPLQTTPYLPLPCERSPDGATWHFVSQYKLKYETGLESIVYV